MLKGKKIVCIIPARLASTRFPEKMLQNLGGKPLLQWVWDAARSVSIFDECHFAIDDVKIAKLLDAFQASWYMTSVSAECGTDRLVELMQREVVAADVWVNWQGDEPFINSAMIQDLLQSVDDQEVDIWTLKKLITQKEQIKSPGYAKVVSDIQGNALYFSRSPIPFYRDVDLESGIFFKHIGIYAFTNKALQMMPKMSKNSLEDAEKLEQLRFLEHGFKIRLHETLFEVKGIDTPQDLHVAETLLLAKNNQIHI